MKLRKACLSVFFLQINIFLFRLTAIIHQRFCLNCMLLILANFSGNFGSFAVEIQDKSQTKLAREFK